MTGVGGTCPTMETTGHCNWGGGGTCPTMETTGHCNWGGGYLSYYGDNRPL